MNDNLQIILAIGAAIIVALALTQGAGRTAGAKIERGATVGAGIILLIVAAFVGLALVGIIGMQQAGVDIEGLMR